MADTEKGAGDTLAATASGGSGWQGSLIWRATLTGEPSRSPDSAHDPPSMTERRAVRTIASRPSARRCDRRAKDARTYP